ncbi:hypothetical protein KIW84_010333 [Lathyrus oleraceus]|uniref:Terpene synthase metal-binding domain-containing protein n=1 Tax=Pisum sativum TaxID=3888 RepID=A0A9D5B9M3_PEA|nr:hypothetical protein KIW84_010333 [Pisum sativum]
MLNFFLSFLIIRWWKRTGLEEKLSFARDRLVENFLCTVGTNFNPNLEYYRKVITKVNSLITIIDDVYDVYGTLEELELFTEAIDRWDLNGMDSLPDYMKICFEALYNFVNEFAFEIENKSGYYSTPQLKKVWTSLCKAFLIEAKWYHGGYTPSFEEYLENAWISISSHVIFTHGYFLIPHSFKMEDLVCLEENSNIIRFSAMISRLANDLGTHKNHIVPLLSDDQRKSRPLFGRVGFSRFEMWGLWYESKHFPSLVFNGQLHITRLVFGGH